MDWSWTAWLVSVIAVVASGVAAWMEGNWRRRPGLAMGFANHGGMWGDLLWLPIANAVIVPHLSLGAWIAGALLVTAAASAWVHVYWYRGQRTPPADPVAISAALTDEPVRQIHACDEDGHSPEHMWPSRPHGRWDRDLSVAGWFHVSYVVGELTLLVGFLLHPMPQAVVLLVAAIFTLHVPVGVLQPRWFVSRRLAPLRQPLLVGCLTALWVVALVKM